MVPRDYVRRKSHPRKSRSRIIPNLLILLAIILVILFATMLYFLAKTDPNKPAPTPKVKTAPPAVTLPEQPQERWTYLKELETPNSAGVSANAVATERQQILDSFAGNITANPTTIPTTRPTTKEATAQTQATTPQTPPPASTKWLLQCGAFKDKTNADAVRAELAMAGISGSITNGALYRVTAGPYNSKNDADKVINILKSNGITSCIATDR
ncbi:SPOR domain-containing protein [Orbaceae bacterium ESL0727]|nr:SPOR domain-containing protein [Orbaceae bacterium ESL0727]